MDIIEMIAELEIERGKDGMYAHIARLAWEYGHTFEQTGNKRLVPGKDYLPPSGKYIGGKEFEYLVMAALDGWWTDGRWVDGFEREFKRLMGVRYAVMVNSGSSANLLALTAAKRKANKWSFGHVLTLACGFPTTLNPILQNNLVPIFMDIELGTYVPSKEMIASAIRRWRPSIVFMAHTLGNPIPFPDYDGILVEDNCDALLSKYRGEFTGKLGHFSTQSFYPAHHITTGEGGMVIAKTAKDAKLLRSLRDWGRDCWCKTGKDDTCGKRFDWEIDGLLYDHKYVYSDIGYNLKSTDLQAAIGSAQLSRAEWMSSRRKENWDRLYGILESRGMEEHYILPRATANSDPSWFGFILTVDNPRLDRNRIVRELEARRIGTRLLFGGNLCRQPAYEHLNAPKHGQLENSDRVMRDTFWVGCWPGLTDEAIDYIGESIIDVTKQALE